MSAHNNDIVASVVKGRLCTGCGLCESMAPAGALGMEESSDGYLRPVVLQPAVADNWIGTFVRVCPGLSVSHFDERKNYHPLWGPLIAVRTGYAINEELRQQASSGGVISAIAAHLIATGVVSYVAQIAVSAADPLRNELQLSRSYSDVLRASGSRYSPSAPLKSLRNLLDRGEPFAIVGKPCDIAALRNFAKYDPRVESLIRYTLSFMCAGVPSTHGTHRLLEQMGTTPSRVRSFRYRGNGWPGKACAVDHDGRVAEMDYATSWGSILNRHLQFRCKICPDGTGEFADIVGADAWHGKDGYPDFGEGAGRSLILSRSERGEALVSNMIKEGLIAAEACPVEEVALMQPYQAERKAVILSRLVAMAVSFHRIPRYRGMKLLACARTVSIGKQIRNFAGMLRRSLTN